MPFTQINSSLAQALNDKGYTSLTPVQQAVLDNNDNPKQDLLVSAQTGSGKTVAYGIAMAFTLLDEKKTFDHPEAPKALIIAPTRELALQVHQELSWLYANTKARIITCIGGMNVRKEGYALDKGCDIVVGTPGRLCDHVRHRHLDLSQLQVMVLDEADEMLDLGFRDELEELLSACTHEHRTLLFSATIDKNIEQLARRYQNKALRINTVSKVQHSDIEYKAALIHPKEVDNAVINYLRYVDSPTTMVFCATRELVRHMQSTLIERGFSCVALSGDLGQDERNHAIKSLRSGQIKVCVATDVAARGLDLPTLDLVIHASLPTNSATLLHRSGRTGRAGRKGRCVLIVPTSQRNKAERLMQHAKITATWENPPHIAAIREKDNQRLLDNPLLVNSKEIMEEDKSLITQLTEQFSATDLANAVISFYRSVIPNPEEITSISLEQRGSSALKRRDDKRQRGAGRDSFSTPGQWYEIPVGRNEKADPKWLIPTICKAGNVQKKDIGDIRIFDNVTKFEISAEKSALFGKSIKQANGEEINIYPIASSGQKPERKRSGGRGGNSEFKGARGKRKPERRSRDKSPSASPSSRKRRK